MASKRGIEKNFKIAGAGHRHADWIPKDKISSFQLLLSRIKDIVGTYESVRKETGLSIGVIYRLKNGELSAVNGRKLLNTYNRLMLRR